MRIQDDDRVFFDIRRAKLRKLAALVGTMDINEAPVLEGNKADLLRAQWLEELWI
jgi:hypothetical protein